MSDDAKRLDEAREAWTDEQAADAVIEVLSEDFEVTVLRSWFMPDPKQDRPGPIEWVARRDHAKGMLQVGRALLAHRAALAAARREAFEEAAKVADAADADTLGQCVLRDNIAAAIRALAEGGEK